MTFQIFSKSRSLPNLCLENDLQCNFRTGDRLLDQLNGLTRLTALKIGRLRCLLLTFCKHGAYISKRPLYTCLCAAQTLC